MSGEALREGLVFGLPMLIACAALFVGMGGSFHSLSLITNDWSRM